MLSKIISFVRRKILRINKYRWDHQYKMGIWDVLREDEMPRFIVARDLLKKHSSGGNILEIGCGEGVFFNNLADLNYAFYEAVDLSQIAIDEAPTVKNVDFRVGDMEIYEPLRSNYSVIVFNEVINYSKDPIRLLKRYLPYLEPNGTLLIGMFKTQKSMQIWADIYKNFNELASVDVQQGEKFWTYKVVST